jgi:hypothetical protein
MRLSGGVDIGIRYFFPVVFCYSFPKAFILSTDAFGLL